MSTRLVTPVRPDDHARGGADALITLDGVRSGVDGTPTFFINGVRYDGPRDGSSLLAALPSVIRSAGRP